MFIASFNSIDDLTMPQPEEPVASDDAIIARALRISLLVLVAGVVVVASWIVVSKYLKPTEVTTIVENRAPRQRSTSVVQLPELPLTDVTSAAGIKFAHFNGAAGQKLLPETMGSGVAWFDFDNDGDQDLFLVNSKAWPWTSQTGPDAAMACQLYANNGKGEFKDVSAETNLNPVIYGMGVAVGDYDNDGWTDVFISAVGGNQLWKNESGKFRNVTGEANVAGADDAWSTSAGFIDYDNDGLLDLLVCNYVQWSKELDLSQSFSIDGQTRAYGPPRAFGGTFPYLYHNDGEGRFSEVGESAGLHVRNRATGVPLAKGMGLAPIDVNGDHFIDFVIANDTVQNFLLVNQQNGTFREEAEVCGIAYDRDGNARGAMGIDAAAIRPDGTLAISIGNFANEPTALYLASGPDQPEFNDLAMATGIGPQTRLGLTFGIFFADIDLDGRLDVVGANGHLEQEINKVQSTQFYAQSPQLFWSAGREGGNQLIPLTTRQTGDQFHQPMVGRGSAYADIDADGDLDFILTANGGPPRLIRNDQQQGNHWLRLKLIGTQSNRSAIGAKIKLVAGDQTWHRTVMPTRSYLSQCELPVTIGMGQTTVVDQLSIEWPSGIVQDVPVAGIDQVLTVTEQ
jgi:hypothetical protein